MSRDEFTELPDETPKESPAATAPATEPDTAEEEEATERPSIKDELRWGAVFLMWFMFVVTAVFSGYRAWDNAPTGAENRTALSAELFGTVDTPGANNWLVPFQVLAILLTAALTAAIVLALRERSE